MTFLGRDSNRRRLHPAITLASSRRPGGARATLRRPFESAARGGVVPALGLFLLLLADLTALVAPQPRHPARGPADRLPGAQAGPLPVEVRIEQRDGRSGWRLVAGESMRLGAVLRFDNGTTFEVTECAHWVSSDTTVARFDRRSVGRGRLLARAVGTTRITAAFAPNDLQAVAVISVEGAVGAQPVSWSWVKGRYSAPSQ
jgi:hypothetical protein